MESPGLSRILFAGIILSLRCHFIHMGLLIPEENCLSDRKNGWKC
jgi:hypothetical protein